MQANPTAEFKQHLKAPDFVAHCDIYVEHLDGCGRYGVGYGPNEHHDRLMNLFCIGTDVEHERKADPAVSAEFVPSNGIRVRFEKLNVQGYEWLCEFAKKHDYPAPRLELRKEKAGCKQKLLDQCTAAVARNRAKQDAIDSLIQQLRTLCNFEMSCEQRAGLAVYGVEDTDCFYEWTTMAVYPDYELVERDSKRIRDIWYASGFVRYCIPSV